MPCSRLITLSPVLFPASAQHSRATTKQNTAPAMHIRLPARSSGTTARSTPIAMHTTPRA